MIISIGSNVQSFKTVEFQPGFNIILAEKNEASTERDTRNGVGKTLLITIIHYCLGGSFDKDGPLAKIGVEGLKFWIIVEVLGNRVTIEREVKYKAPAIVTGMPEQWLNAYDVQKNMDSSFTLEAGVLNKIMGDKWFGLSPQEHEPKYPTFRQVIHYFARYGAKAFIDPFKATDMSAGQMQVMNAFLLKLGWELGVEYLNWKEKSDNYSKAKGAVESGLLPGFSTVGALTSELVRLQSQYDNAKLQLSNFHVIDGYEDIKKESTRLTRQMQSRQNENVSDDQLLRLYQSNLQIEADTEPEVLTRVFEEAGLVFGDAVKKTLQDVKEFHQQLVANRKSYLENELRQIQRRIAEREADNREDDAKKSELLNIIKTAGAMEELDALKERNAQLASQIQVVKERIETLEKLSRLKGEIAEEKIEIERKLNLDYSEREAVRTEALRLFMSYVDTLYECEADLLINIKDGFKFASKVQRDDAEGIGKMKIFCYDLVIATMWSTRAEGPLFLIHDTTLFDGVEDRQRGHALELAWRESEQHGFQYITFCNSDYLPSQESLGELNPNDYVRLTLDDSPDGHLLGFRFE